MSNASSPAHVNFQLLGLMRSLFVSARDPIFWMHHANIDRIWSEWMHRHGQHYLPITGGPIGHNLDDRDVRQEAWNLHRIDGAARRQPIVTTPVSAASSR